MFARKIYAINLSPESIMGTEKTVKLAFIFSKLGGEEVSENSAYERPKKGAA